MSDLRDELRWLVERIPEERLRDAIDLLNEQCMPLPPRAPGLPKFVGMLKGAPSDLSRRTGEILYGEDAREGEDGSSGDRR
ncbi:hypothetical protein ACQEU5_05270 [Marinactinospora thermotolerans]|uniref:Uncharacterized protein n=1 Tax=Marinactinospora thermotolerans DSM 45154 TaxID=1122192 RepID=A0A1T4QP44_9ACTN|nr:hypothetical protein [Marinactinospora thermotolerans]SKA05455.1 hypothetical protein SAMN02745673_02347 [Marinactinospora thermotolerans DSM 45154]